MEKSLKHLLLPHFLAVDEIQEHMCEIQVLSSYLILEPISENIFMFHVMICNRDVLCMQRS
jgi:hypothetical protein